MLLAAGLSDRRARAVRSDSSRPRQTTESATAACGTSPTVTRLVSVASVPTEPSPAQCGCGCKFLGTAGLAGVWKTLRIRVHWFGERLWPAGVSGYPLGVSKSVMNPAIAISVQPADRRG